MWSTLQGVKNETRRRTSFYSVALFCYADCRFVQCRYANCRGALTAVSCPYQQMLDKDDYAYNV
jgi:hypothetical protein